MKRAAKVIASDFESADAAWDQKFSVRLSRSTRLVMWNGHRRLLRKHTAEETSIGMQPAAKNLCPGPWWATPAERAREEMLQISVSNYCVQKVVQQLARQLTDSLVLVLAVYRRQSEECKWWWDPLDLGTCWIRFMFYINIAFYELRIDQNVFIVFILGKYSYKNEICIKHGDFWHFFPDQFFQDFSKLDNDLTEELIILEKDACIASINLEI